MIKAKRIDQGSTIGFVSPSGAMTPEKIEYLELTRAWLHEQGFKTVLAEGALSKDRFGVSGGEPAARAADINSMFMNPAVHAIWCTQGGDTANEILPLLDFEAIRNNPKPFMGLSNITVFLNSFYKKTGLITFHTPDPKMGIPGRAMDDVFSQSEFVRSMSEGEVGFVPARKPRFQILPGKASGKLIGGNLSSLLNLAGTEYFPDCSGSILLIEGYRVPIVKAKASLAHLRDLGVFDQIAGLLVGDFFSFDQEGVETDDGKSVSFEEILTDFISDYSFPAMKFYEAGHRCPCSFLPIGCDVSMDCSDLTLEVLDSPLSV